MRLMIVCPTVTGREEHLNRWRLAYERAVEVAKIEARFAIYENLSTCARAWNLGAWEAMDRGYSLLHLSADDLEPSPGALKAAIESVERGEAPSALIFGPDGNVESHGYTWGYATPDGTPTAMTRIPTVRTEWWHPIPDIHYWSDNAVSSVLTARGIPIVNLNAYAFRHHWAQEGRLSGSDDRAQREKAEWQAYDQSVMLSPPPRFGGAW